MIPAPLAQWYAKQSERDQRVLRWGLLVAAVVLLVGILLPLQRNLSRTRAQVEQQQSDLAWMRSMAPTLAAAGPGPAAASSGESLVVLIDRSARESGLAQALTGSQPAGNGGMTVRMENADFNLLIGWLSRLAAQHDLRVESASVTGNGTPGIVNVSVQLHSR